VRGQRTRAQVSDAQLERRFATTSAVGFAGRHGFRERSYSESWQSGAGAHVAPNGLGP